VADLPRAAFFNDRPKEVPARLLDRWARPRRANHDTLPVGDLCEIAISAIRSSMRAPSPKGEGAYGLEEWEALRSSGARASWRLLAALPAELRRWR